MTAPHQFTDTGDGTASGVRRDPSELLTWERVTEIVNPQGQVMRPGKLLIVRPLEVVKDRKAVSPEDEWKRLVYVDVAVLDGLEPTQDQYYQAVPAVAPGTIYRNQLVFPGKLISAWKPQVGNTLLGVIFLGPAARIQAGPNAGQMGKPPFLWRSLTADPHAVTRGQGFMAAHPHFLVPVPREQAAAVAQFNNQGFAGQQGQQPGWNQAPATALPPAPPYQGDPWAQNAPQNGAQPVSPAPQVHPNQGMSTLDQMRAAAAQNQGPVQDPPF